MNNQHLFFQCILSIGLVPYVSEHEWTRIGLVSLGCFGYAFFGYPVIAALVDAVILRVLSDQKDLYGRQKIGVPIGFATSVFFTGLLTEKLGSLYALFIVFTFCNLAFVTTMWFIDINPYHGEYKELEEEPPVDNSIYGSTSPPPIVIEEEDDAIRVTTPIVSPTMWTLLREPDAVQFFTFMMSMGFAIAVVQAFLFLYFENDLQGTAAMVGLFGPLGSSTELVVFFFSKEVIQ